MHLRLRAFAIAVVVSTLLLADAVHAQVPPQNLPPPGGYQAIPNFSGPGAGLLFRTAINDRFSGVQQISPRLVALGFASLPPEQDGLLLYCVDCHKTIPCAGGGSGAWAFGQNGQWTCTAPNAPANVIYSGQSGATLNGLANTGNESIAGTLGVSGAASLASESVNSIVGSGTAPALSGMNINGRINVRAYGASGAGPNVTTGTISASSSSLAVASASGWSAGMGIRVAHAGAATSLSTPGAPTVTALTTGSTTYSYKCVAVDGEHGYTAASSATTITNGAATADNRVACPSVSGEAFTVVYQTSPGSYRVGITSGTRVVDTGSADSGDTYGLDQTLFNDLFYDIPATAPSSAGAGWLDTTISSISGTTFTLAANASTSANSQPVSHDDTAPITTAWNVANATGQKLYFPGNGTYEWCGASSLGSSSWNNINMAGAKQNSSVIDICPGKYLIEPDAQVSGASIRNLTFNGGAGVYKNLATAAMSQGYATHAFADNTVMNFTGTAFSQTGNDEPFWLVRHNSFSALDDHASIGVVMSSSTGEQVVDNNFQNMRIGLKLPVGGTGVYGAANSFIRMMPQANALAPRIGIWIVPASNYETGEGFVEIGDKFGNENLANDDVHVLVADDDTTSGTDESNYLPLYDTADDLSISASATTLTSAAECPFTSTMCQGGTGCTGSAGNWPIVIEGAGPQSTAAWNGLTTTITGFSNSCSVTVGNAATTTVTGAVGRFAPADTTNTAGELYFAGGYSANDGYAGNVFMVSTATAEGALLSSARFENNTLIEMLPTHTNNGNAGNSFVETGATYLTNQDQFLVGTHLYSAPPGSNGGGGIAFGASDNSTGGIGAMVAGSVLPRIGACNYGAGICIEGSVVNGAGGSYPGVDLFAVFPNDGATRLFDVTSWGAILSKNNTLDDGAGDATFAGAASINKSQTSLTGSSGTATCVEPMTGSALKTVSCYLNAYKETGTAQSFTFPTAFSTTPVLLESGGSCGTYNPTTTATVLTLPANASMSAETCNVILEGQ